MPEQRFNPTITLTLGEICCAVAVGSQRQQEALRTGMTDPRAVSDAVKWGHWSSHIEGACAELAVCKALGLHWTASINTNKREPDIPPLLEVRMRTPSKHAEELRLILRPNDRDERSYVLVTGYCPTYRIGGVILGKEGKRQEWWTDPNGWGGAFFIPESALTPFDVRLWAKACWLPS